MPPFGSDEVQDGLSDNALDEIDLRVGDMVYLPRGMVYETKTPSGIGGNLFFL